MKDLDPVRRCTLVGEVLRIEGHGLCDRCRDAAEPDGCRALGPPVRSVLMQLIPINASTAPKATGGYVNALQVEGASSLLFISGQIPQTRDGHVPANIEDQCRLVWANLTAALGEAGMEVSNLVKVTTFLSSREHAAANTAIRNEILGPHSPALTVVLAGIWDPAWLIEIEAIAAA